MACIINENIAKSENNANFGKFSNFHQHVTAVFHVIRQTKQTSISKLVILGFQKLFRWPIRIQVRFGAQSSSAQGDSCIYKSGFWAFSDLYIELLICVSVSVPAHLHYRISGIFTHFYLLFNRLLKYIRVQCSQNIIFKAVCLTVCQLASNFHTMDISQK